MKLFSFINNLGRKSLKKKYKVLKAVKIFLKNIMITLKKIVLRK